MNRYVALLLVANFAFAFCILSQEAFEKLKKNTKDCQQETGATDYEIQQAKKELKIPDVKSTETFAVCMLKKWNVLNNDGSINANIQSYELLTDNPLVYDLASRCKALAGQEVHETARKVMTCLMENNIYVL